MKKIRSEAFNTQRHSNVLRAYKRRGVNFVLTNEDSQSNTLWHQSVLNIAISRNKNNVAPYNILSLMFACLLQDIGLVKLVQGL